MLEIRLEPGDAHGRQGGQVMGVERVQELPGDFREVVVERQLQPAGQEREGLHQALHVGVGDLRRSQLQTLGDLGVAFGEDLPHVPEVGQLFGVETQQPVQLTRAQGLSPPPGRGGRPRET